MRDPLLADHSECRGAAEVELSMGEVDPGAVGTAQLAGQDSELLRLPTESGLRTGSGLCHHPIIVRPGRVRSQVQSLPGDPVRPRSRLGVGLGIGYPAALTQGLTALMLPLET